MSPDKIKKAFEAEFIHGDWDLRLGGYQARFLEVCTNLTVELIEDHIIHNHKSRPLEEKKGKEIALEATIKIWETAKSGDADDFMTLLDKIYIWLIKEDKS